MTATSHLSVRRSAFSDEFKVRLYHRNPQPPGCSPRLRSEELVLVETFSLATMAEFPNFESALDYTIEDLFEEMEEHWPNVREYCVFFYPDVPWSTVPAIHRSVSYEDGWAAG